MSLCRTCIVPPTGWSRCCCPSIPPFSQRPPASRSSSRLSKLPPRTTSKLRRPRKPIHRCRSWLKSIRCCCCCCFCRSSLESTLDAVDAVVLVLVRVAVRSSFSSHILARTTVSHLHQTRTHPRDCVFQVSELMRRARWSPCAADVPTTYCHIRNSQARPRLGAFIHRDDRFWYECCHVGK